VGLQGLLDVETSMITSRQPEIKLVDETVRLVAIGIDSKWGIVGINQRSKITFIIRRNDLLGVIRSLVVLRWNSSEMGWDC